VDLLLVRQTLSAYIVDSFVGLFVFLRPRTASWALIEPYFEPYSISLLVLLRRRCVSSFLRGVAAYSALLESSLARFVDSSRRRFVSAPVGEVQP
jgi:hypothetical protein